VTPFARSSALERLKNWQKLRITEAEAPSYFNGAPQNVGIILGEASHGLTDIDLDCAEAVAVAPYFLPHTGAIFGRGSRPGSHWLYQINLSKSHDTAVLTYRDPCAGDDDKAMIVELRIGGGGKGAQTVFPGSVHESGEQIKWDEAGDPAELVDGGHDLERRVRLLAAAALWRKQARHDTAMAIGGLLARGGWKQPDAKLFMEAVAKAAGDEEWRDRRKAVEDTFNTVPEATRRPAYRPSSS